MTDELLHFAPIDLGKHARLCIEFRLDSYVCSFGTTDKFYVDNTNEQAYVDWLRVSMQELPGSCVHLWQGAEIIGQLELQRSVTGPEIGYVNLYYLVADARGSGVGGRLDDYGCAFFADLGLTQAWLNVRPSNDRAIRHYEKHGWQNLGVDAWHPEILMFGKILRTARVQGRLEPKEGLRPLAFFGAAIGTVRPRR
jgi:GNAT superfamily N-acetyltransferase